MQCGSIKVISRQMLLKVLNFDFDNDNLKLNNILLSNHSVLFSFAELNFVFVFEFCLCHFTVIHCYNNLGLHSEKTITDLFMSTFKQNDVFNVQNYHILKAVAKRINLNRFNQIYYVVTHENKTILGLFR